MSFSTNNNKRRDSFGISGTVNLLSLLQHALSELEEGTPSPCSFSSHSCTPISFRDPFADRSMEPLPIRSKDSISPHRGGSSSPLPSMVGSSLNKRNHHNDNAPPPTSSTKKVDWDGEDLCHDLFVQLFGNKRNYQHARAPSSSTKNILDWDEQEDLCHDPIVELVGHGKRSLEDFFCTDQQDYAPPLPKRQRTSYSSGVLLQPPAVSSEEMTARFRPKQEKQWRVQLQKLIKFKLEHGHCCVPHTYQDDPILARWVKRQRYQYKKLNEGDPTSTMTLRRKQELESIGFAWHAHTAAWLEKLNELKAFKERTGHCNVPSHYPQNVCLSTWVKCQRRQYKRFVSDGSSSSITTERFRALESMGFAFERHHKQPSVWKQTTTSASF